MIERDFGDILAVSMDKIKSMADAETVIGEPIHAPGGLTIIPVSRVSMGLATGGLGAPRAKDKTQSRATRFGGGGGTGINITPIAFLMIDSNGGYDLLPIPTEEKDPVGTITSLIEHSPEIIKKFKQVFSSQNKNNISTNPPSTVE